MVAPGAVINARWPSPIGVAKACGTDRAATGVARATVVRTVATVATVAAEPDGDVVALTATGESCAGGVTKIISTPSAASPTDPVAIANPRVDRCAVVCWIASRSAAASSDG